MTRRCAGFASRCHHFGGVVAALPLVGSAIILERRRQQRPSQRAFAAPHSRRNSERRPSATVFLLLRGWRELVGESEFGLRSLSAFAGVVTVAGAWALVRLGGWQRGWTERRVVAVATLLVAVSPALVYYSQEAYVCVTGLPGNVGDGCVAGLVAQW